MPSRGQSETPAGLRKRADQLSLVGEYLVDPAMSGKDAAAALAYARLLFVQSCLRIDAEELEKGRADLAR